MLIICHFQVADLAKIVEEFTSLCEKICGKQSANLKAAFKIQAGNYVQKFHHQRKSKLAMLLDAERYFFFNFRLDCCVSINCSYISKSTIQFQSPNLKCSYVN